MTDPVKLNGRAAPSGLLLGCALLALTAVGAQAQQATTVPPVTVHAEALQTTGAPGSPDATTTIDGRYVPPPPRR
jgi:hypothetical protein